MQAKADRYHHAMWKEREARVRDRMNQLHAAKASALGDLPFQQGIPWGDVIFQYCQGGRKYNSTFLTSLHINYFRQRRPERK